MRLKQIKLAGFKSFVDPTIVNFNGNLSAVVGPNGCGKSNIMDAISFVLGVKTNRLRASNLTDLLSKGKGEKKKKKKM